jgi:hypothetical protein
MNARRFIHKVREQVRRSAIQETDHRHHRLLRARRRWPGDGSAAQERDELASSQLIELHSVPSPSRDALTKV